MIKKSKKKTEEKIMISMNDPNQNTKRIPKFCNVVFFSKHDSGNIAITFALKSKIKNPQNGEKMEEANIIETVMVDSIHAQKIIEKLTEVVNE